MMRALIFMILMCFSGWSAGDAEKDRFVVVQAALQTGMPEIALAELNKMQEHDGDYWLYLGQTFRQLERGREAVDAFTKAIELQPDRAAAYDGMGMAYSEVGEPERGVPFLQKATELAPMEARFYHDLGKVYLLQHRYRQARKPLAIALRLGGDTETAKHLAFAMTLTGDEAQAKALLMEHYDLKEVYCYLGEAHELGGEIPEAVAYYRLALLADGDYRRARERLTRLTGGES